MTCLCLHSSSIIRQVRMNSYLPERKIYLSQTKGKAFFRALYLKLHHYLPNSRWCSMLFQIMHALHVHLEKLFICKQNASMFNSLSSLLLKLQYMCNVTCPVVPKLLVSLVQGQNVLILSNLTWVLFCPG